MTPTILYFVLGGLCTSYVGILIMFDKHYACSVCMVVIVPLIC